MENKFKELGLSTNVLKSIDNLGYTTPSEIQALLIPVIMNGKDTFGQAKTGTGKTLAFAASVLSKINKEKKGIKAIILSPTRELAMQIGKEFQELDKSNEFNTLTVYGGSDISKQIQALRGNVDIVIGTPGRVKDLIERKKLNLTTIDFFVLDEADEMLNMGFIEDIETILYNTSRDKQVLMLSATMSKEVKVLVDKYMREDYEYIHVKSDTKTNENIEQNFYIVNNKTKLESLCRIIDSKVINKAIIFVKTKKDCDEISMELQSRGYDSDVLHGDISQNQRIKTLHRFKSHSFKYLIATDVAARGIHVDNIDLVVNYHLPFDKEAYIHRIGRTGRANSKGEAISLITSREIGFIGKIEKFANCKVTEKKLPNKEEIITLKYNEVLASAQSLIDSSELEDEMAYVRDLNKADVIKLCAALLKQTVTKAIGSDLNADVSVKERKVSNLNENKDRVFINIGKKDRFRKNSLIEYITELTGIKKSSLNNVEVLETFSFVDVDKEHTNLLIKTISQETYNGRSVNAEISEKKGGSRSNSRSRDRGSRSRNSNGRDRARGNFRDGGRSRDNFRTSSNKRDRNNKR